MVLRTVLKPSLLIIHGVTERGGSSYRREEIEEIDTDTGGLTKSWKTTKVVFDKAEFAEACALVSQLKRKMQKDTDSAQASVGIICPRENENMFEQAERDIRQLAAEFNARSRFSKIEFRPMVFEIHPDDTRTLEAIASNISASLRQVEEAIAHGTVKNVRDAIDKLVGLDKILPEGRGEAVKNLIDNMRKQCRTVVAAAKKEGRNIDQIQAQLDSKPISAARFAIFDEVDESAAGIDTTPIAAVSAARFTQVATREIPESATETATGAAAPQVICLLTKQPCANAGSEDGEQVCECSDNMLTEFMRECPAA